MMVNIHQELLPRPPHGSVRAGKLLQRPLDVSVGGGGRRGAGVPAGSAGGVELRERRRLQGVGGQEV